MPTININYVLITHANIKHVKNEQYKCKMCITGVSIRDVKYENYKYQASNTILSQGTM